MQPITQIATRLGLSEDLLEPYGRAIAKIRLEALDRFPKRRGKLILVTAITPTTSGEGKTVNTIGITQGLAKLGHHAIAALREPSLGPVFGMKGGATGGGQASLDAARQDQPSLHRRLPRHHRGAQPAGGAARCAPAFRQRPAHQPAGDPVAALHGHERPRVAAHCHRPWRPRKRAGARNRVRDHGGVGDHGDSRAGRQPRRSPSASRRIVVGFNYDGAAVTAADLKAVGPMMVLLNEAIMPNLVQTTEGAPAIVHCGPFANIAHGTSSVLAQRLGLHLADYVVNETGFAADLGAEKFFDLVMPMCGHVPAAAAVIVTLKALRAQGGSPDGPLEPGFPNLVRHLDNLKRWGVPAVIALNRFPGDTTADLELVLSYCRSIGADAALAEGYSKGGDGMTETGGEAGDGGGNLRSRSGEADLRFRPDAGTRRSPRWRPPFTARQACRSSRPRRRGWQSSRRLGYGTLPVCIAKTQYSFTDDPKRMGAPSGWTLTVSDVSLSAGAGFVVAIAGSMMLMPGLGKVPQAQKLDVDDQGAVIGMDY